MDRVAAAAGPTRSANPPSDRELAARLMTGDTSALAEAYDRYAGLVHGVARRVLRDGAAAEDVTQEVFTFLWQSPERFDPTRGSLRAWLGVLAHRRSIDRVRADRSRANRETRNDPLRDATPEFADIDDRVAATWLCERVQQALSCLPDEQRSAIVLAYYGGRTYREVAVELAIPEGTAKSRLRLGLRRLGDLLGPTFDGQDSIAWT